MNQITKADAIPALSTGAFIVTPVGLLLDREPTWDEWQAFMDGLARLGDFRNWVIGDAATKIEAQYGHKGQQLLNAFPEYEYDAIRDYMYVSEHVELAVRTANLYWSHHKAVAPMEPKDQTKWLAKAKKNDWSVKDLRVAIRDAALVDPPLMPEGTFNVVYADPPWRYEHSISNSRRIENQYPTMELEDIKKMPERKDWIEIAEDAVLFLWATSPKVEEALEVMNAWDFKYRTCMAWIKDKIGMGYYVRQQHELLLIGGRGNSVIPAPENRPSSVIEANRLEHSAKPNEVYLLLERMYPNAKPIELFARTTRKGWTSWGNETLS